jgi:hypothetical protein
VGRIPRDDLIFLVEPQVRKLCGPLFFTTSPKNASGVTNNASFGLVNTGKKRLLVTCQHVWEEFKKMRSETPELLFCLCLDNGNPLIISPEALFVDEDKRSDLVTFDVESLLSTRGVNGVEFFDLQEKPPPKVKAGDVLYLIGFPGKGRIVDGTAIGFTRQPIGVQASEVGEFGFYSNTRNLKMEGADFEGISGSPCFLVAKGRPIRLVGFATGVAERASWLQFTYASCIRPDGTIKYMR